MTTLISNKISVGNVSSFMGGEERVDRNMFERRDK